MTNLEADSILESKESFDSFMPLMTDFPITSETPTGELSGFLDLGTETMFAKKKSGFASMFSSFGTELNGLGLNKFIGDQKFEEETQVNHHESGVDGLGKHLAALDLNVDNHISRNPSNCRLNFSISGHASMTPNPRSEFKSPQAPKFIPNEYDAFAIKSPKLREKITFADEIDDFDFFKPQQAEFHPPQLHHYNSASSLSIGNNMYSNFQPMQPVMMANGMPAVVVPASRIEHHNQSSKMTLRRATSFDTNNARKQTFNMGHVKSNFKQSTVIPEELPLSSFKGQIFQMSQEQNGCRYLQQKIDREKETACSLILHEVRPRLEQLMMDPFGNYLFQKLIETVTPFQRLEMLRRVKNYLVKAALNIHGTRSVQKFIELGGKNIHELEILVNSLSANVTVLSMDTNGNHVVQKCLQQMPESVLEFVYETALRDVLIITKHRHGCCVFQRCIDRASPERRDELVGKIISNAVALMQDPFGNYVVQYVLDNCTQAEVNALISQTLGMLPKLSMQKFSSNVVETCLSTAPSELKGKMIDELARSKNLRDLLHHQYANYVIQRAVIAADEKQGLQLVRSISPYLAELAQFNPTCARKVVKKVNERFPSFSADGVFADSFQFNAASTKLRVK